MLPSSARNTIRTLRRNLWRITSATLLAALTATSLGVSIPKVVNRISDELYPCMSCSCGCPSAEACWRDCCCYSQQEKLAWAEKNGVTPPSFVVVAAEHEPANLEDLPPCCRKRLAACRQKVGPEDEIRTENASPERRPSSKNRSRTIVLLDVLRCQGVVNHITGLPPCVVPPAVTSEDARPTLTELAVYSELLCSGERFPPELPPPQYEV